MPSNPSPLPLTRPPGGPVGQDRGPGLKVSHIRVTARGGVVGAEVRRLRCEGDEAPVGRNRRIAGVPVALWARRSGRAAHELSDARVGVAGVDIPERVGVVEAEVGRKRLPDHDLRVLRNRQEAAPVVLLRAEHAEAACALRAIDIAANVASAIASLNLRDISTPVAVRARCGPCRSRITLRALKGEVNLLFD